MITVRDFERGMEAKESLLQSSSQSCLFSYYHIDVKNAGFECA